MIKVINYAYLPLDTHVDVESFDAIIDDLLVGIAKSKYAAGPTNTGPGYIDKSKQSVYEIYRQITGDCTHPYFKTLASLKNWEPYTFIQYKWPSHVLGQCLVLRSSGIGNYTTKHQDASCKDYPIMVNFTSLMSYIESQEIFQSIGRVVVFLNEAGTPTLEHKDYEDGISRKDQFIWISPQQTKKFYIRDNCEKIYVESKFCYFDSANIHGADPVDTATFSIRIDGVFSDKFKQRTGLTEYFDD